MKIFLSTLGLSMAAIPAAQPAFAQAATIAAGAKVLDTNGGEVGTVTAVSGDMVTLKTDKHEVAIPKTSFAVTEKGLLFAMTQAQLNAEAEKAQVKPADLLKVGAVVRDNVGGTVGTIEAVDSEFATVKLPNLSVKLNRSAFAAGPNGLILGMTAAQMEAQAAAAAKPNASN
jgi:preprotein translocase subunit YajC